MSLVSATAPGKIILFGEHAVVYGQPALAVPVSDVQVKVTVAPGAPGQGLRFDARDLNESYRASERPESPLSCMAHITLDHIGQSEPDATATIESTIPVAGGLGSGAAVSAALGRALAAYMGRELGSVELSALVFEIEKLHHGTPSGIDNTVICHARPVYFVRGHEPEVFQVGREFHLIIGDTGIASSTRQMVDGVRARWSAAKDRYDALFASIGGIVQSARAAIETGDTSRLGSLMQENQAVLREMKVSSPRLDELIGAAVTAGASGAKLSGAGGGGNIIALADPDRVDRIKAALELAGAARAIHTIVHTSEG